MADAGHELGSVLHHDLVYRFVVSDAAVQDGTDDACYETEFHHVDGIEQVINYEVPFNREAYVHRVGRAGRAGSTGTAITLVSPDERHDMEEIADAFGLVLFEDAHAELVQAGEAIDGDAPVQPCPEQGSGRA